MSLAQEKGYLFTRQPSTQEGKFGLKGLNPILSYFSTDVFLDSQPLHLLKNQINQISQGLRKAKP